MFSIYVFLLYMTILFQASNLYKNKRRKPYVFRCYIQDIPINPEFLDHLDDLLKVRKVQVYHRDPNKKKITPIIRSRTLKDYDPAMILFEYMKQENLRLIDLFRTFDTDSSQSVSKDELKEGFVVGRTCIVLVFGFKCICF